MDTSEPLAEVGQGRPGVAGALAVAAGVAFLAMVTYLFAVLGPAGLSVDMFDDPRALLPWVDRHRGLYQGMWLLYLLSQVLLLPVPWLLGEHLGARTAAVVGTVSVVIALVGLVVLLAASPVTADAYQQAVQRGTAGGPEAVLTVHTVAADIGKDLRLVSEVLLGAWLILAGGDLRRRTGRRGWWALAVLGGWAVLVAAWKLVQPAMPLEDWLGFLLGAGYAGLGAGLLRRHATHNSSDVPSA
ncbi:MAG TPA: hypothetical protein VFM55_11580 [Micromonosporaceae bacterium]|nr:hypothetical protein [Micromonosporaceae bacterium]